MNPYVKNVDRMEFIITYACTGRCKHCSEGEHTLSGEHLNGDLAVSALEQVARRYCVSSVMTFGGEPLLYIDEVVKIHTAALKAGIKKRQLITNGYFTKDNEKIAKAARLLAQSGVNDLLLSVDAFHQETIPLEPVIAFAKAVKSAGVPIRTSPAWLVSREDNNAYNVKTREILKEFSLLGIAEGEGNVIFPSGNAVKYLNEYFKDGKEHVNPYEESPENVRTLSFEPNGDVLDSNVYEKNILDIIEAYGPKNI